MSPSDETERLVMAIAKMQGIPLDPQWIREIAVHLERLIDASDVVDRSAMKSQELAQRFLP